ncbi:MAG: aspartate:alanine exchanger family transporter [Microcoleaceae cyanobacterium]
MEVDLYDLLKDHPELVLFLLLTSAYLIGRIRIGQLDLGTPPGMLIAGLVFGHFGFKVFPGTETIGLLFFLYAVAFQAGPAFFSVVLADGVNYVVMAALATAVGFVLTYLFHSIFQFDPGVAAGLLAGSLTSPAGVAAALDAVREVAPRLFPNFPVGRITENISVTYAITYLIGDVSVILLARSLPGWLKFDLVAEASKAAKEKNVTEGDGGNVSSRFLTLRAYQVKNSDAVGMTVKALQQQTDCSVLRYKRDGALIEFQPETQLELGDRLSIWGQIDQQDLLDQLFGAEVADDDLLAHKISTSELTVTQPEVIGKTIGQLEMIQQSACYLTKVSRSGIELPLNPNLQIARGDVLILSGPQGRLGHVASQIGYVEHNVNATDLVTFSAGVVAGFLIGQISFNIGGVNVGLGTAGGLLLVGILLGYLRSIHPTFGRVPPATLWVFKELGLLLFLAGIGVEAGRGFVEAMQSLGVVILLCSLVIATLPVIASYLYGQRVGHMNPALLLGAVTGAVTCTPAMAAVSEDARSTIPTIGYAGTYAFATVFSAIACSIMTRF